MLSGLLIPMCAMVLLRRRGVSMFWIAALAGLLAVLPVAGLAITAPGYVPSLFAQGSGRMLAGALLAEVSAMLLVARVIRIKV